MAIRDYKDTKKIAHLQLFPSKNSVFHRRHTQNSPPLKKFAHFCILLKKFVSLQTLNNNITNP